MCPLCLLVGLFMIYGSAVKPSYFWVSRQVLSLRSKLGDRGAEFFYYFIGGGIVSYGLFLLVQS
jgi:hypothetical protein